MRFTAACIQTCAGTDVAANIADAAARVREAKARGADLACLPEYFSYLELSADRILAAALSEADHPALPAFRALAAELGLWILLGSLAVRVEGGQAVNRSYLIAADGRIAARYDKLHLFDVDLVDGESYRESATVEPGDAPVVAATPWGTLGLSICYDLRFPLLYRELALAGAEVLAIPAAFTRTTGVAHWHVLVRARAIETGSYVLAPSQCGDHPGNRGSYGHSLIVDPWGRILADAGEAPGIVLAEIDTGEVAKARRMIPNLRHGQPLREVRHG